MGIQSNGIHHNIQENVQTSFEPQREEKEKLLMKTGLLLDDFDGKIGMENDDDSSSSLSSSSEDESDADEAQSRDIEDFGDVVKPFKTVFETGKIEEHFLPGVPVRIIIRERTRQPASHRLNPNLYTIEIVHGKFKWVLKKRFKHFQTLKKQLEVYRAAVIIKHPTMATRLEKVPKLPLRPEFSLRSKKNKDRRMQKLQKFLQKVMNIDKYRNNDHVLDFMEVCYISFIEDLGSKHKEQDVMKRAGGHTFSKSIFKNHLVWIWHDRWLILRNGFVAYIDKDTNMIRDVLLFDNKFKVSCDKMDTGIQNGLMISNNRRNLVVRFGSAAQARSYLSNIVNVMGKEGCDWIREHRYDSFAPIRQNTYIKWFIDGEGYFAAVADAIKKAKEEIFITDWWMSPELILKRPVANITEWRLDKLLEERAKAGVKVFILLYKELEMTLSINSFYTKKTLSELHPNIKVLRHPDHYVHSNNLVLYWGHHEKLVCIDQKLTFMGGLDLCYGRWDDHTHRLNDFGSATPNYFAKTESALVNVSNLFLDTDMIDSEYHKQQLRKLPQTAKKWFIGKDYCNFYVQDISEVDKPFTDLIDRNNTPRMPWHDIACAVYGHAARDIARHFIERWNFTKHLKSRSLPDIPYLLPRCGHFPDDGFKEFNISTLASVQILRSASQWSTGLLSTEHSILDAYKEQIRKAKHYIYIENQFFITTRSTYVNNTIGELLVERILLAHANKETFRVYVVMPLLPSFPGEIGTPAATSTCFIEYWNLNSARTIIESLLKNGVEDPSEYITFNGLRNYADLRNKMVTEILYVHSKLMIVDDEVVIMGSANINDRSLLGDRDSELAVCVQDDNITLPGLMNGVETKVGGFASTLRRKLFQEHLGLLNEPYYTVVDPISEHFFKNVWCQRAKKNTEIYEQVFGCIPNDQVKSFTELDAFKKQNFLETTDPVQARNLLKEIQGFIVEKPLDFLKDQNLFPAADSKEGLVPIKIFT